MIREALLGCVLKGGLLLVCLVSQALEEFLLTFVRSLYRFII